MEPLLPPLAPTGGPEGWLYATLERTHGALDLNGCLASGRALCWLIPGMSKVQSLRRGGADAPHELGVSKTSPVARASGAAEQLLGPRVG